MVSLDYALSASWNAQASDLDLRTASEADLRYSCLLGDVAFAIGSADFGAPWRWVPVLDFALALRDLTSALVAGSIEERFEFTESDAAIIFRRVGEQVVVSTTLSEATADVSAADLADATRRFLARMIEELVDSTPGLGENPYVRGLAG